MTKPTDYTALSSLELFDLAGHDPAAEQERLRRGLLPIRPQGRTISTTEPVVTRTTSTYDPAHNTITITRKAD